MNLFSQSTTEYAHNFIDRTGHRYGKLVVLERVGRRGKVPLFLVQCDCNGPDSKKVISGPSLASGNSTSCGCSRHKLPPGRASRNVVCLGYKQSHNARRLGWGLTDDEFDEITGSNCHYCGSPPSQIIQRSKNGTFIYNGIDRIDNTKGYFMDNVVPCCGECNHAKATMTYDEFLDWIARVIECYLAKKGIDLTDA